MKSLKELNHLPANNMQITKLYNDGIKHTNAEYQLTTFTGQYVGGNKHKTFTPNELLRVINNPLNDFEGEGLLVRGDKLFKQALAEMEYTNGIYDRGALPLGILKQPLVYLKPQLNDYVKHGQNFTVEFAIQQNRHS